MCAAPRHLARASPHHELRRPANSSTRPRIHYHCRDELRLSNLPIDPHMTETKSLDIEIIQQKIQQESGFVARLLDEVGRVIVGQRTMVERLLIGLLADGHVLLEGVPGLAKTLTVRTLADALLKAPPKLQCAG